MFDLSLVNRFFPFNILKIDRCSTLFIFIEIIMYDCTQSTLKHSYNSNTNNNNNTRFQTSHGINARIIFTINEEKKRRKKKHNFIRSANTYLTSTGRSILYTVYYNNNDFIQWETENQIHVMLFMCYVCVCMLYGYHDIERPQPTVWTFTYLQSCYYI